MAADSAQSALMRPQSGINDSQICLGTTHKEMDFQIVIAAVTADVVGRSAAVVIGAVARRLLKIGFIQFIEDLRMAALAVVIIEVDLRISPPDIILLYCTDPAALCQERISAQANA